MPSPIGTAVDISASLGISAAITPVNVTIPSGADTVIVGARQYSRDQAATLVSATLGGDPPDEAYISPAETDYACTLVLAWFGKSPGTEQLQMTFSHAPLGWSGDGNRCAVVDFASSATAARDGGALREDGEFTPLDIELTTESSDLVWKFVGYDGSGGTLAGGWTERESGDGIAGQAYRASIIVASGATTEADNEGAQYASVAAVALYGAAPSGGNRRRRLLIAGGMQ